MNKMSKAQKNHLKATKTLVAALIGTVALATTVPVFASLINQWRFDGMNSEINVALRHARLASIEVNRPVHFSIDSSCSFRAQIKGDTVALETGDAQHADCSITKDGKTIHGFTYMPDGYIATDSGISSSSLTVNAGLKPSDLHPVAVILPSGLAVPPTTSGTSSGGA